MAAAIFDQIGAACRALDVVVAGGHSEITPTVSQPVVSGHLLGEVRRARLLRSGGCRPGEVVLLAGAVPVEGTSIIAREKRAALLAAGWAPAELDAAANYLFDPGISILKPALLAADAGLVTAMHDPTEGGVATGLLEMALAADAGLAIDLDAIPVPDLARRLCAVFDLDPLGTIASGALLATAAEADVPALLQLWRTRRVGRRRHRPCHDTRRGSDCAPCRTIHPLSSICSGRNHEALGLAVMVHRAPHARQDGQFLARRHVDPFVTPIAACEYPNRTLR